MQIHNVLYLSAILLLAAGFPGSAAYRNVALNPDDTHNSTSFPHASSNSETRDDPGFYALNAINGDLRNTGGHNPPEYLSWGPNWSQHGSTIWWRVDFGKEMQIDKIKILIRHDFPHDTWFTNARLVFSDNSTQNIVLDSSVSFQTFSFASRKSSFVKIDNFQIKAKPQGQNSWAAFTEVEVWGDEAVYREPDNPTGTQAAGLVYRYYPVSTRPGSVSEVNSLTPAATGVASSISTSYATAQDDYYLTFDGYISIPSDGTYTFYTSSDDGSVLYIGQTKVVDNDGSHATQERAGSIALKSGMHALRIVYFQASDEHALSASIEGNGLSKRNIPESMLFHISQSAGLSRSGSGPHGPMLRTELLGGKSIDISIASNHAFRCDLLNRNGQIIDRFSGNGTVHHTFSKVRSAGVYFVRLSYGDGWNSSLQSIVIIW